jgi:hypothetical protein
MELVVTDRHDLYSRDCFTDPCSRIPAFYSFKISAPIKTTLDPKNRDRDVEAVSDVSNHIVKRMASEMRNSKGIRHDSKVFGGNGDVKSLVVSRQ